MKLVATEPKPTNAPSNIETFVVTTAQLDFLGQLGRQINPEMPIEFAGAHVVRTLLERFEESGIDLTSATSEEELTRVAATGLNARR